MNDKKRQHSLSYWVELLRDGILMPEVDEKTISALCCHLSDLGVLENIGDDDWRLTLYPGESSADQEELEKRLNDLCQTKQGFALQYFLKDAPTSQKGNDFPNPESADKEAHPQSNPQFLNRKTSNLSNLQIVNKYGRQVESFIELEKSYTDKLQGPQTSLKEARKIFNFILSRMKQKIEPRPWEQLSRRRHK